MYIFVTVQEKENYYADGPSGCTKRGWNWHLGKDA